MSLLSPPRVYVDESNSTGENLLDPSQPVFVLGAVNVQSKLAATLLDEVTAQLPKGHGEPKYSALAKTQRGRRALLECLSKIPDEAARVYVAHKLFVVEAKMVDLLIEPMAHRDRYDMYADGAAVGLANLMHQVGPVLGDKPAYERMLATFVKAIRSNRQASIDDLFLAIGAYCQTASPDWRGLVEMFLYTRNEAEDFVEGVVRGRYRDELDPAIPCLVALVYDIGKRIGPFTLVHDESKVVAKHALQLLNIHELPNLTRPGKRLPPLPAVTIEFSDSKGIPQLQLADWVAGAGRQWATQLVTRKGDRFADRLEPIVRKWLIGGAWPDPDTIGHPTPRTID